MSLTNIAIATAQMKIDNPALWDCLFKKLDQEGLYRNMSLLHTWQLLDAMIDHGTYSSHPLVAKLQKVIYQQKNYFMSYPTLLKDLKKTI